MKFFITASCFILVLLVACENNGGKNIQSAPPASTNVLPLPVPATTTTPNTNSNNTILPSSVNTSQGKLNPAHGQPDHRCDIAVGAPLNSAPVKNTNTITPLSTSNTVSNGKTNPPLLPVTSTASNTVTAPGMNPQHGQPGHRCDIAVGAPLNSKPNQ